MSDKISFIFPSRGREKKFFAALDNIIEFSADDNYEVIAVLDKSDESMNSNEIWQILLTKYRNVSPCYGDSTGKISAINKELDKISDDTKIVCLHSDDMVFIKKGFDNDIRAAFADGFTGLVHFPDQIQKERLCTYPIMHIEFLKFQGYIFNPEYKSLYADKELQRVSKMMGKYKFVDIDILEHHHVLWGYDTATGERTQNAKPDKLMEEQNSPEMYDIDRKTYLKNKNLAIVTSLSLGHANKDQQILALKSWKEIGEIYSLNPLTEIKRLKELYENVTFIETNRTFQYLGARHLVSISAMIDFAIERGKDLLILNSDILLHNFPDALNDDGITMLSRYDYEDSFLENQMFEAGFDGCYIPNVFLSTFPQTVYALGNSFWDHAMPYRALLNNIPVYWPQEKYAFHKKHTPQYNYTEWEFIGEYFRLEFKLNKNMSIPEMVTSTFNFIKSKLITGKREKNIDIFYKSYAKDFKWLYYSLDSLKRNVTGYNRVIVLVPEADKEQFDETQVPQGTLIVYIKEYGSGYLFQQVCKLNAYRYCTADYILFSDSDCIFDHKVDVKELIKDDRPQILYTDWAKVGEGGIWRQPTEDMMGEPVLYEFMRRNTLVYHRSTMINIQKWKPNIEEIVMSSKMFSEFNLIGAYAFKYEKDKYVFTNTDDWEYVPPTACQLWSHASKEENAQDVHLREYIRSLETIMKASGVKVPE